MNVGAAGRPRLVLGLGNPGPEYAGTRHNVGFEALDRVAQRLGCSLRSKPRFAAQLAEALLPGGKLVLARPLTFMNRSGLAAAGLLNWLKLSPAQMLVVVDDADLPAGRIRLRLAGGSGGHNGLRSIIEALGGDEQFPRLRIGIGRSAPPGQDITGHVLARFSPAERPAIEQALADAAETVLCSVEQGVAVAMNRFNRKQSPDTGADKGDKH
jgi:PTH1 family peptidyl-tRNA hydrolase